MRARAFPNDGSADFSLAIPICWNGSAFREKNVHFSGVANRGAFEVVRVVFG